MRPPLASRPVPSGAVATQWVTAHTPTDAGARLRAARSHRCRGGSQRVHAEALAAHYISIGYSEEMTANIVVKQMNAGPVARQQRDHFRIYEFIVSPQWKAVMATKRAADAPPPYRPALAEPV